MDIDKSGDLHIRKVSKSPKEPFRRDGLPWGGKERDERKKLAGFFPDKLVSIENIKDGKHGHDNNDCCDCFN